jgi:hypothetical protein
VVSRVKAESTENTTTLLCKLALLRLSDRFKFAWLAPRFDWRVQAEVIWLITFSPYKTVKTIKNN